MRQVSDRPRLRARYGPRKSGMPDLRTLSADLG